MQVQAQRRIERAKGSYGRRQHRHIEYRRKPVFGNYSNFKIGAGIAQQSNSRRRKDTVSQRAQPDNRYAAALLQAV